MSDFLAIISKAQFEAAHRDAKLGEQLGFTKYGSSHAALEPVRGGGSLFLVTVRPPDERLWLLAELVNPSHDGKAWVAARSTVAVRDITALLGKLVFTTGKGISAKKGALGMSLQTPRALTAGDVKLLRSGNGAPAADEAVPAKAPAAVPAKAGKADPQPAPARAAVVSHPIGSHGGALAAALAEWRTSRAPGLEELIVTLGEHHARAFPPLDPDAEDYDAAWTARANVATPEDLDNLIPGLWSDPRGSIPMRLRKLLDLGADPRLGAAFLKMIDEPPLTASSNFSAWTTLFKALPSMVDTRATKRLQARAKKKGGDSQFWPKLTLWIQGALKELAEAATLTQEQAASVAKRQAVAKALLEGAPPAAGAAPKRERGGAPPMKGTPREVLEAALAAARANRPLETLEPLRGYWAVTRAPQAAELMTAFARLGRATQPDFARGKAKEIHERWLKEGRGYDATLVTPLLEALLKGTLSDAEERLEMMLGWPPDPRVAEAMCDRCIFGRDPYIGARPQLWKRTYDLLVRSADPRFLERLTKNATRLESAAGFDRNRAERPHASRTIVPYTTAASAGRAPSADEQQLLAALSALAKESSARTKAAARPDQELGLLQAINAAAPDDVTPYLVYADFLAERGDPRAELINLSLAKERGEKVKSKLEAWVKDNERALLGNLKMRLFKPLERLERGFFRSLGMDPWGKISDSDLEPMAEDLRWVTARTISLPSSPTKHADFLLGHAPLYGMERLNSASSHYLELMCRRDFPWALEVISFGEDLALSPNVDPRRFPKLEELHLHLWNPAPEGFFDHPLVKACKRITSGDSVNGGAVPVDALVPFFARLPKLETYEGFSRPAHARFPAPGAGRFDVKLDVGAINPKSDPSFARTLEGFKKLPAGLIRRFDLGEVAERRGYAKPNAESTAMAEAATKHLPRA